MGDIVISEAVFAALRLRYPQAEIWMLCKEQFIPIAEAFEACDQIVAYRKELSFHKSLRKHRFDLVIDIHAKLSTFILRCFLKADRVLVYQKQHFKRRLKVAGLYRRTLPPVLDLYLAPLRKAGIITTDVSLPKLITTNPLPQSFVAIKEENLGKKLILLFAGAAHFTKMYPIEQWVELIDNAPENWHFILCGSREEHKICAEIDRKTEKKCDDMSGKWNLEAILAVIKACDLVLSNDSGPMHIAAAFAKAQVAIFCSTHPDLGFAPQNPNAIVLCANLDCQPCSLHGLEKCPQGHYLCMKELSAQMVLAEMRKLL